MARPELQKVTAQNVDEMKPNYFVGDASDLGFPIGFIPLQLATDLGNEQPFLFVDFHGNNVDIRHFNYKQANGFVTLTVYND